MDLVSNASNGGFLNGFVEASVELPADGLNGDCVVHYGGDRSEFELMVTLVNGVREGEAMIVNDGVPYLRMDYKNGMTTGDVERMNHYGIVDLKGQVVNGVENGLFEEFDNSEKMVWRGYYRNGMRYSEVVESGELAGYYDEKSVATGLVLTIAQYDKDMKDKNGRCFEYKKGSLKGECVYENGVKKHTIREFVDGKMIVYGSDGKKVYEGDYYGDMKSGFLCHEQMEGMDGFFKEVDSNGQLVIVSQYDELNVYRNGKCFELEDGSVKRVCLYENGKIKQLMMEFNDATMTEYNESGKKEYKGGFRGDMVNGFVRDGDGKEYDANGRLAVFSGQWHNGKRNGLGTEYKGFKPLYTGEWSDGKRNGNGKEMDERGKVVKSGVWVCGVFEDDVKSIIIPSSIASQPSIIEEVVICDNSFNDSSVTELKLNGLIRLRRIVIGDDCFKSVQLVMLDGLNGLESIVIGKKCFNDGIDSDIDDSDPYISSDIEESDSEKEDDFDFEENNSEIDFEENNSDFDLFFGFDESDSDPSDHNGACLQVTNCSKLKTIQIDDSSFQSFNSFVFNNLPSLRSVEMGTDCFYYTPSFSLTGITD